MSPRRAWLLQALLLFAGALAWLVLIRPSLALPYFWDEADVYVPGALWLAEHRLDIRPGHFPDDWSRGHPQGLYLLAGMAFRWFGASPVVGRAVVLPFAALALASTFLLGRRLAGWQVGAAAALLLGTTPLFLSIGGMLLPEGPLVGLAAASFLALAHGRLGWAALCGVLAVWTKETGIFAAGAVGLAVLWDTARLGAWRDRAAWRRLALVALPLPALAAFFLWQKLGAGYFVFPHHGNLLWERPLGMGDTLTVWPSLLGWHGRWLAVIPAAAVAWWAVRRARAEAPSMEARWAPSREAVVAGLVLLVLLNAVFFTKMFWLERYALPAHVAVVILTSWSLVRGLGHLGWGPVGAAALLGIMSVSAPTKPNEEEHTFAWVDVIENHALAFEALPEGATVLTAWPMTVELQHPYIGFVDEPVPAVHIDRLEPGTRVGAALIPVHSRHREALVAEAERRRLHRVDIFSVGRAPPLELWTP